MVGEPAVKAMETGFDIVVTLVTQGPAAAWDKIKEQLGNLKDMVIGGITDFVVDTVVKKAIPKLIAMFIPGAGFISAIISIYDTVMVFVNKISQIIQVVTGFIDSIVAIAGGQITAAANKVEQALANVLSLAINFLAGFVGLGKVADKVMGVIGKVRATIDKALDALINWIVTTARRLFARVFGGRGREQRKGQVQKSFNLPKESHHVAAIVDGETIRVTVSSERAVEIMQMLTAAKAEVSNDKTRDDRQRASIISNLDRARQVLLDMGHDWRAENKQQLDPSTWAERRMALIVNWLEALGGCGIKAFRDFKGQIPPKRFLPQGYDVREKLYLRGGCWSAASAAVVASQRAILLEDVQTVINNRETNPQAATLAWQRIEDGLRLPEGSTMKNLRERVLATQYDVDHMEVLSMHWESQSGNNLNDAARWSLSQVSKLRYITHKHNVARPKGTYVDWVGPNFVSVYAQGGEHTAKKIDGLPFLDAPGGTPI